MSRVTQEEKAALVKGYPFYTKSEYGVYRCYMSPKNVLRVCADPKSTEFRIQDYGDKHNIPSTENLCTEAEFHAAIDATQIILTRIAKSISATPSYYGESAF